MKKSILTLAMATLMASGAAAAPLWLRNVAISPEGDKIAFTYKGNIYTVPTTGGNAQQITSGGSYNTNPIWSPDGTRLAFSSDRDGSMDIYIVGRNGGVPKRLTTHSGTEVPLAFSDNENILFRTSLQPAQGAAQGGFMPQTYTVNTEGKRPSMVTSIPMMAASVNPEGKILYQDKKGFENEYRKHETSSSTGDIWLLDGGKYTKLTSFNGNDQNPVWGNGDTYYYVSEEDGTLNVYSNNLAGNAKKQLSKFTTHPVRSLSASRGGKLAFSWDGEIYTLTPGGQPQKVTIDIVGDEYVNAPSTKTARSGADNFAVSPDGETIAFIADGDVYLTSVEYETTRRVTDTPAQERVVDFAPDGKSIVYDSERDGIWQLFTCEIKDPKEKSMLYATELVEKPLYKGEKAAFQPAFSPDGKKVAFLEDRTELKVIDLASKAVNIALDGKFNYSYTDGDVTFEWSPDSRWLLADYIGIGGWNNKDIALVKADGSEVVDLTESGYSEDSPLWVMDGKAMVWASGKYGYKSQGSWGNLSDVFIMFLDGEAYDKFKMTKEESALAEKAEKDEKEAAEKDDSKKSDKKKSKKNKDKGADEEEVKPLKFDLDNRRYRVERLTPSSTNLGAYYLAPKGDKLYYVASSPDGRSLYELNLKEGETKVLCKGLSAYGMDVDKKGENLYVNTNGGLQKIALSSGEKKPISFAAEQTSRPAERRQYMFDHMWQQVKDKFYDVNLHGVDWEKYRTEYQKFLPYINNNYDFAILLSEILGELNASHTGGRYYGGGSFRRPATAYLGAFFDENYDGDGLKIKEVIKRGPLSKSNVGVKAGDVIISIGDSLITAGADYYPLLEGKTGKKTRLEVKKADGTTATVYVRPISGGENSNLLYQRWIEHNEHVVDSVSGGKVGYVHVEGMDGGSYSEVFERLLGKYRNCDAVVVDTRYNGGGWLHNDLAILLSGKEYVRYTPRGRYIGSEPFSQWNKPSVMLVNESNYSDAHGAPFAYQTLGLGKVVGAPIPGTMTAVWWENQIDPTIVFGIPQVTSSGMDGKPMENRQLNPDVLIYNAPEAVLSGIDEQLIGATKELMKK